MIDHQKHDFDVCCQRQVYSFVTWLFKNDSRGHPPAGCESCDLEMLTMPLTRSAEAVAFVQRILRFPWDPQQLVSFKQGRLTSHAKDPWKKGKPPKAIKKGIIMPLFQHSTHL